MPSEFSLIERFFQNGAPGPAAGGHVALGIGDDCALLALDATQQLAISTDMLVAGRHFLPDVAPAALGHKSLAVNLSDLAAMGARPRGFTLALALPRADEAWLADFSAGLFALAGRHACPLIGGDTTAGPLTVCITVFGEVPASAALHRDGARPGDDIWVSGILGDARLALGALCGEWPIAADAPDTLASSRAALERPEPRVALGLALREVAHAAIDLSDGLAGDLKHILTRSNVSAEVDIDAIPRSPTLAAYPPAVQRLCAVAGGDDYELCFTAPPDARRRIEALVAALGVPLGRIGRITPARDAAPAMTWRDAAGLPLPAALTATLTGFDHFHAD